MFWSKIWLFIVAAAAAIAVTVALLLPRPAQRNQVLDERQRLVVACDVVNIQLRDSARVQVDVAGAFSRQPSVVTALEQASAADAIDEARAKAAREIAADTIAEVEGSRPDFAILVDRRGRVVARAGLDEAEYGDTIAGRWLIDDALAGYLRDDLWVADGRLWRVAASPVIKRDPPLAYVGAVVVGNAITKEYAEGLMKPLGAKIAFYAEGQNVAASTPIVLDRVGDEHAKLTGTDLGGDCRANKPFSSRSGKDVYTAVVARLPGEAQSRDAFYAVFIEQAKAQGLMATLDAVRKDDMGFSSFPWLPVALGFLVALGVGLGLMILEADRPVRKLAADAVMLAKAQVERLPEEAHGGRFGSIARSINIQIDKLTREARAARRDLDQLLGPGDGGDGGGAGLGTLDLGGPVPARPEAPRQPPPPSEFRFSEPLPPPELDLGGPAPARPLPGTGSAGVPKPPVPPARPRPPVPSASPGALLSNPLMAPPAAAPPAGPTASNPQITPALVMAAPGGLSGLHELLTEEVPAGPPPAVDSAEEEASFRAVFNEFVELKKRCGESIAGLTLAKFSDKLRKNRDDLMAKPGCVGVKFSVYVKDGKAALKATPVKSE